MEIWEAMERENQAAERGLVPLNGGGVQVQHEQGGAKMDGGFVHRGQSCRYASTDIPSDLLVKVGGVNYHLHKHPMISRCGRLARLVDDASYLHGADAVTVIELPDLPGGNPAFELATKFCYGVAVGITAGNAAALRCAAEYLEMSEELEEGNLASRAEAFLSYVVASSWRDSVAVLRSCGGGGDGEVNLSPWADELQIVRRCAESVAAKACTNPRAVRWAYAGSRTPSPARRTAAAGTSSGDGGGGSRTPAMPLPDWWVDDVCVLGIDHFVRVLTAVQAKGMRADLVGAAVTRYATKWLGVELNDREGAAASRRHGNAPWPAQAGGALQMDMIFAGEGDTDTASEQRRILESLISIIPRQRDSVSCSFLLRLLRLAVALKAAPALVAEVEKLAGAQLDQAALADILVPSSSYPLYNGLPSAAAAAYNVDLVQRLVEQFVVQEQSSSSSSSSPPLSSRGKEKQEMKQQQAEQSTRAQRVARLVDGYLLEVSRDRNLSLGKFQALAESVPEQARTCHDALYRAVDAYLKAHPAAGEHERKRLCRAVDCGRLSREARAHAARNERLPVRVAVRVILSEQEKMDGGREGRKEKEEEVVAALRMEVESVTAKYMELQREVELLQRQVERLLPPLSSGKQQQQNLSGWASGWKKLGRLGRIQVEQPAVMSAAGAEIARSSREPRRRRNSAS